jgi:hypothetical protein
MKGRRAARRRFVPRWAASLLGWPYVVLSRGAEERERERERLDRLRNPSRYIGK